MPREGREEDVSRSPSDTQAVPEAAITALGRSPLAHPKHRAVLPALLFLPAEEPRGQGLRSPADDLLVLSPDEVLLLRRQDAQGEFLPRPALPVHHVRALVHVDGALWEGRGLQKEEERRTRKERGADGHSARPKPLLVATDSLRTPMLCSRVLGAVLPHAGTWQSPVLHTRGCGAEGPGLLPAGHHSSCAKQPGQDHCPVQHGDTNPRHRAAGFGFAATDDAQLLIPGTV